ncbi:MAG: phosphatidate cytidylyltransferase [Taibaiella sp.]|nr:phosphatidate cytidylyltransferase [Taibaiella sp.]
MNWPVFFTRLGSAVIFTGIMLLGLMYEHPMAILLLAALVIFLCIKEFFNISKQIYADQHFTSFHFLISLAASAYLIVCMIIKIPEAFLVLTIIPVSLLIWSALSKKKHFSSHSHHIDFHTLYRITYSNDGRPEKLCYGRSCGYRLPDLGK